MSPTMTRCFHFLKSLMLRDLHFLGPSVRSVCSKLSFCQKMAEFASFCADLWHQQLPFRRKAECSTIFWVLMGLCEHSDSFSNMKSCHHHNAVLLTGFSALSAAIIEYIWAWAALLSLRAEPLLSYTSAGTVDRSTASTQKMQKAGIQCADFYLLPCSYHLK